MTVFTNTANTIFAPTTAGGAPRGANMGEVQIWGTEMEYLANLAYTSSLVYSTRAALYANLVPGANTPALVIGDPTAGYDGLYMKVGATTTGSWTRLGDVPGYSFIKATDAGAGTANAIVATSTAIPTADGGALIALNIFETNTSTPVTVAFNGGTALTIKTNSGNDVATGGLTAGMIVAGYVSGSTFRLLSDQASAAIQAAAEAAQAAAEAAAAAAAASAALVAGTYQRTRHMISANETVNGYTATFNDVDEASANNTFIEQWLGEAYTEGLRAVLPAGTLYTAEKIVISPTADLIIEGIPGLSIIKGADDTAFADADRPVLEIDGLAVLPRLFILGGLTIDNSLRTFESAAQSGTALSLKRLTDFDIHNFKAVGAFGYFGDGSDGTPHGDTAASILDCRRGRFWYPIAIDQPDVAWYPTGNSNTDATDDYADIEFISPYAYRCGGGVSSKRQARRVVVRGGLVEECRTGHSLLAVNSHFAGREMLLDGCQFKRVGSRAIWSQYTGIMTARDCVIEDFGYNYSDVALAFTYAISLEGASRCDIDARVRMRDWSGAGLKGARMSEATFDTVDYIPDQNRFRLFVEGVETGLEEATNGSIAGSIGGGDYDLKVDASVTTPVTMATGSTSRAIVKGPTGTITKHFGERSWVETKVTPATAPTMVFSTVGTSSFAYTNQLLEIVETEATIKGRCRMTFTPTIGTGSGALRVKLDTSLPEAWDIDPAAVLGVVNSIGANWVPPVGATSMELFPSSNGMSMRWIIPGSAAVTVTEAHVTNAVSHELAFAFELML